MANELAILESSPLAVESDDILASWLSGRKATTVDAYRRDMVDFARFVGARSAASAVEALLHAGHGGANRLALAYRANIVDRGLASATVRRRLAALRSMAKLARQLGRIEWSLDVESPRVARLRDTSGPGLDGWRKIRSTARRLASTTTGKRNAALIALLHDLGLRRAECSELDLRHVDLDRAQVSILGKGQADRQWLTLPPPVVVALAEWIAVRGSHDGPLFCRLDRAGRGLGRLTGHSVNRAVGKLGRQAGVNRHVRAHGLRHQAITRALDLTNGNIREAQAFSRHADPRTVMAYDDNRLDRAGKLACMLSADDQE